MDSLHPLVGTWRGHGSDESVEYTVFASSAGFGVRAIDATDGEELEVAEVAWDGGALRFTTFTPSTKWRVEHELRSLSQARVEHLSTVRRIGHRVVAAAPHAVAPRSLRDGDLDSLLPSLEPSGSFHDALLLAAFIDYHESSLTVQFDLCVGNPDASDPEARERRRRGRIVFSGLAVWAFDPPSQELLQPLEPLWLTAYGALGEAATELAQSLAGKVGPEYEASGFLYFSDLDAFAYYAAKRAQFDWL